MMQVEALHSALLDAGLGIPRKKEKLIEEMRQRFTSGNDVPVTSARITKADWDTCLEAFGILHRIQEIMPVSRQEIKQLLEKVS